MRQYRTSYVGGSVGGSRLLKCQGTQRAGIAILERYYRWRVPEDVLNLGFIPQFVVVNIRP